MISTKMKRNLLFIDHGQTCEELCQILDGEYNVTIVRDMTAAKDILQHSETDIQALLIYADLQEDIGKAVKFVKDSKRLISIPILTYTDKENPADELMYLGSGLHYQTIYQ